MFTLRMFLSSEEVKLCRWRYFLISILVNHLATHQTYPLGSDPKTSSRIEHTLNDATRLHVTEFLIKNRFNVVWLEKKSSESPFFLFFVNINKGLKL